MQYFKKYKETHFQGASWYVVDRAHLPIPASSKTVKFLLQVRAGLPMDLNPGFTYLLANGVTAVGEGPETC